MFPKNSCCGLRIPCQCAITQYPVLLSRNISPKAERNDLVAEILVENRGVRCHEDLRPAGRNERLVESQS